MELRRVFKENSLFTRSQNPQHRETSSTVDAYNFQAEAWREYSFVLTDEGGFPLAIGYRNFITGTQVKSDDAFGEKRVSINAGCITVKDDGYDQAYYDVPIDSYYNADAH